MTDIFCEIHNRFKDYYDDNPDWNFCYLCEDEYFQQQKRDKEDEEYSAEDE